MEENITAIDGISVLSCFYFCWGIKNNYSHNSLVYFCEHFVILLPFVRLTEVLFQLCKLNACGNKDCLLLECVRNSHVSMASDIKGLVGNCPF